MNPVPLILGAVLGGGVLLVIVGLRRLTNGDLDEADRRRGFWPLNTGLLLAVASMYLMFQVRGG